MKSLTITHREKVEKGVMVDYEILEDGVVESKGQRLVPTGFDRLLIPQLTGVALSAYL
jgi:hypothetical protein